MTQTKLEPQNPLILRSQRLMEAFAKSDDERDFYLDRQEGFILYVDLDKPQQDLETLEKELSTHGDRYCMIPKLTFYETKKIMEGFVNEKVYDIDTKEKLLDIIQSKEARENFLEFIYDHHAELEKWQQYYQERSRIRIIEWLRINHFHFVFEEDLDLAKSLIEKVKRELFQPKASKDVLNVRKLLAAKAKTYYSNEALNPRPKRGRPPKQAVKLEIEPQVSTDIYTTVPAEIRSFLFIPDFNSSSSVTFSSKFESEEEHLASRRALSSTSSDLSLESLNLKLAALRTLSSKWVDPEQKTKPTTQPIAPENDFSFDLEDDDDDEDENFAVVKKKVPKAVNGKAKKEAGSSKKAGNGSDKKVSKGTAKSSPKDLGKSSAKEKTPKKPVMRSIIQKKPLPKKK